MKINLTLFLIVLLFSFTSMSNLFRKKKNKQNSAIKFTLSDTTKVKNLKIENKYELVGTLYDVSRNLWNFARVDLNDIIAVRKSGYALTWKIGLRTSLYYNLKEREIECKIERTNLTCIMKTGETSYDLKTKLVNLNGSFANKDTSVIYGTKLRPFAHLSTSIDNIAFNGQVYYSTDGHFGMKITTDNKGLQVLKLTHPFIESKTDKVIGTAVLTSQTSQTPTTPFLNNSTPVEPRHLMLEENGNLNLVYYKAGALQTAWKSNTGNQGTKPYLLSFIDDKIILLDSNMKKVYSFDFK